MALDFVSLAVAASSTATGRCIASAAPNKAPSVDGNVHPEVPHCDAQAIATSTTNCDLDSLTAPSSSSRQRWVTPRARCSGTHVWGSLTGIEGQTPRSLPSWEPSSALGPVCVSRSPRVEAQTPMPTAARRRERTASYGYRGEQSRRSSVHA